MKIPFLDLQAQLKPVKKDILFAIEKVIDSGHFIMGDQVRLFEEEVAKYLGVKHAISCASGSDALLLSLMAAGVKRGDEVITTPFTFFATSGSIARLGAIPVFVDIDKKTYNLDTSLIKEKITSNTKAIIPVHIFGQSVDMGKIMIIAKEHNVIVIEDACQAIGSKFEEKKTGTIGDMGCFSFFPTKNLGCFGDGGLITTNDDSLADFLRKARLHGSSKKYYHDFVGFNSRLDAIQATVLRVKLPYLDVWNEGRQKVANAYSDSLKDKFVTPFINAKTTHIFHQYVLLAKDESERNSVLEKLKLKSVASGVYYPIPLHLQNCFDDLKYKEGDFPVSEDIAKRVFSLPIYPEVDYEYVIEVLTSL